MYGAGALYPYFSEGRPCGLLNIATERAAVWTERNTALSRSVGRSLGLALERSEHGRRLTVQNRELES